MSRHSHKGREREKSLRTRSRRWILLAVLVFVAAVATVVWGFTQADVRSKSVFPPDTGEPRAAIVDSLSIMVPNTDFIANTSRSLETGGFKVDVFQGEQITVNFYRQLTGAGYDFIVLRVHSGLLVKRESEGDKTIWLFTNEPYRRMGHYFDQLRGRITSAKTHDDSAPVFAISANFIRDCTEGKFHNAAIVSLGCASFYSDEMALAFINIGASVYLGWDASVGVKYVDEAAMMLVDKLSSQNMSVAAAVKDTMAVKGPEPNTRALLKFYPPSSAALTVKELLK